MNLSWLGADPLFIRAIHEILDGSRPNSAPILRKARDRAANRAAPNAIGEFELKVAAEFEPFLALAPHVAALPWPGLASSRTLIAIRPLNIHILGEIDGTAWADGAWRTPLEFFYHDLDHARYKIREDLISLGYACPDAYQSRNGGQPSTLDPETGLHRLILPYAAPNIAEASAQLREFVEERLELARHLFEMFDRSAAPLAQLAESILFEIVHEKSIPLDRVILARELQNETHLAKMEKKRASGFYGEDSPLPGDLRAARDWLFTQWNRL